jgi:5-methylcytosine-specific restriction endonuclease McrA
MKSNKPRKKRQNVTVDEYLTFCQDDISVEEYFSFEKQRVEKLFKIKSSDWIEIIKKQSIQCHYCGTDLRTIQQLILNKIIKPRKRGPDGFSGLHFELDHKNANKDDNCIENLVASCYYCNNDKSNTFSSDIFKCYFGHHKKQAFDKLLEDRKLAKTQKYRHNLKGKPKN